MILLIKLKNHNYVWNYVCSKFKIVSPLHTPLTTEKLKTLRPKEMQLVYIIFVLL